MAALAANDDGAAPPSVLTLDLALAKFKSVYLPEPSAEEFAKYKDEDQWIPYLSSVYTLHPDRTKALLGEGSYGAAYKVKSAANPREPLRVAKVIIKSRVCKPTQVQHVCAELAVTGALNHPRLNRRVGLFHTPFHMFIILELCAGPRPDVLTRIAHIIAYRKPHRLAEVDAIMKRWQDSATGAGVSIKDEEAFGDWVEEQGLVKNLAAECGVNLTRDSAELPVSGDLFSYIVAYRRLADPFNQIVTRQTLLAVSHLHENMIVHRDIKTENIVIAITRKSCLIRDEDGNITGVKFFETIDSKLIDFGLVKFMLVNDPSTSPGGYARAIAAAQEAQDDLKKKKQEVDAKNKRQNKEDAAKNDDGDDDDEEEDDEDDEDEPEKDPYAKADVNKMMALQAPAKAGSTSAFPVASTACGTEIYASRELLAALVDTTARTANGRGGSNKWMSSSLTLPKVDTFGVSCCSYCCSAGKPPFRPPDTYRRISREERLRQIERLVASGPIFPSYSSEPAKEFVRKLMNNDENTRPSCMQALQEPFVDHNCDSLLTVIHVAGAASIQMVSGPQEGFGIAQSNNEDGAAASSSSSAASGERSNSDQQKKSGSTASVPQQQQHQQQQADQLRDGASPCRDDDDAEDGQADGAESNNHQEELMEAMRLKEDGVDDAAGKPSAAAAKKAESN